MRNLLYRRAKPWALSAVVMAMAALQAVALPAQAGGVVYRATYLPNAIDAPDSPWRGLGGSRSVATAISQNGLIVGSSTSAGPSQDGASIVRGVVMSRVAAALEEGDGSSTATAVNSAGQVMRTISSASGVGSVFLGSRSGGGANLSAYVRGLDAIDGVFPASNGRVTLALSQGATVNTATALTIDTGGILSGDGRIAAAVSNHGLLAATPNSRLIIDGGLDNHGLVTGSGRIEANLINRGGGAAGVRVGPGQNLTLAGSSHTSADGAVMHISGGGELHFEGRMVHQGGAVLQINGGTLRADQGLHNAGRLQISFGGAEIFGELNNDPAGQVIASGGAHTTFWDRVVNDGEIRASASAGAQMVYFGAVSGSGGFTTNGANAYHRFEGGYAPGASAASVSLGDVQFVSLLTMELGGLSPGNQHDQLVFTGSVLFDSGSFLEIALITGFSPKAGDRFALFSYAQAPSGMFEEVYLPTLSTGLSWDVSQLHSSGVLWVSGVPEPGSWVLMSLGLLGLVGLRSRRSSGNSFF